MRKFLIALFSIQIIFLTVVNTQAPTEENKLKELITLFEDYMATNKNTNVNENKENFLSNLNKKASKILNADEGCWLRAFGRGVGKVIHSCRKDLEQSGLLCYPKCQENYTGVGPVCWQNCQNGFRDDGAYCFKTPAYGRGVGYVLGNKQKCEDENPLGCEKYGLLYYPKCKTGYHNFGCCICTPDCQEGQTDIGISCNKASYGRGVGIPLGCDEDQDYDAGLCYKKCEPGLKPIGPVCWDSCPEAYEQCGALCLKGKKCSDQLKQYFTGVIDIIMAFASQNYPAGIIDIGKFVTDFIYPICDK